MLREVNPKEADPEPEGEAAEVEGQAIGLERPHGFLVWRGKQTAIASDEPLPVGEPLTLVSAGEAYGQVTLATPSHMTLAFFDQPEQVDKHCVYASERRLWWPEAEVLYMHEFEKWEPLNKYVPAEIKGGRVVYRQPDRLSREEKELMSVSKTLPKMISLESLTVAVDTKDPTRVSVPGNMPWQLKTALSRVLRSTLQREVHYVNEAYFDHIPVYELALVRPPRLEIKRVESFGEKGHSGAMVALFLGADDAGKLELKGDMPNEIKALPAQELHITLAYLGDAKEVGDKDIIQKILSVLAAESEAIRGKVGGLGRFSNDEGDGTNGLYASFDSPALSAFREELVKRLANVDSLASMDHGFTPHITLAYVPADVATPEVTIPHLELEFSDLSLAWGEERFDFSLGQGGDEDKDQPDEEGEEEGEYEAGELAIEDEKQRWSRKLINDLPDSHFLYVETGGKLDEERKTKPRRLRHFPFKNSAGNIDLPHLRNAIARIPQARDRDGQKLSRSLVERLQREAREMLAKENERREKSVAGGEAEKVGRRLRKTWIEKLREFGGVIKELLHWAEYQEIDLTKEFDTPSGVALKEVNGELWYFVWSTNAFEDREGEMFSTKSLEQYVLEASEKEDRGYFNFWHIAGTDFARKKWQAVVGRFLVEAGPFLDNHAGKRAKKFFEKYREGHPEFAPEGWGSSPEFRFLPEEQAQGFYDWVWITKTSTLPRAAAANIWTQSGLEVKVMTLVGQQKDAAIALFGEDFVKNLIKEGEQRTENLEGKGVAHKGQVGQANKQAEAFVEALQKLAGDLAEGAIKEQLMEIAGDLTDDNLEEQGAALQEMSAEIEDEELQAQVVEIAEAMQGEEAAVEEGAATEEAPAPVEEERTFTLDQIVEALSVKMQKDFSPFAEALASVALEIKMVSERMSKLEKSEALKQNTEIPRYTLSLTRASEAGKTAITEDDDLNKRKPAEVTGKGGSLADAFFGH